MINRYYNNRINLFIENKTLEQYRNLLTFICHLVLQPAYPNVIKLSSYYLVDRQKSQNGMILNCFFTHVRSGLIASLLPNLYPLKSVLNYPLLKTQRNIKLLYRST